MRATSEKKRTLWERISGRPGPNNGNGGYHVREEQDSFADLELPTSPGTPEGGKLYDKDLHELMGRVLGAMGRLDLNVRKLKKDVRTINRRHTAFIGGIMAVIQGAVEVWRHFHH